MDGDEDEHEVGQEGPVEPVVAGGGLAVLLHPAEQALHDVPPITMFSRPRWSGPGRRFRYD